MWPILWVGTLNPYYKSTLHTDTCPVVSQQADTASSLPPQKIELVDTELEPPQTISKLGQASCVEAHIYAPVKVQAEAFTTITK